MSSFVAVVALGFFLGMRHAADPDHVIAVTTIVTRHRTVRGAAAIGAAWGLGHTLTILVVGAGIIVFSWVIPPRLGLSMEFAVGIMLIVLGLANLKGLGRAIRRPAHPAAPVSEHVHSHAHSHGDYVHTHPHGHTPDVHPHAPEETPLARLDRRLGGIGVYRLARPFVVGVIHGLAGSAAIALLVMTAIGNPTWAWFYLVVFGAGTILGMMLITATVALPMVYGTRRSDVWVPRLRLASGLISIAFGCWLAYRIGVGHGLFRGASIWIP